MVLRNFLLEYRISRNLVVLNRMKDYESSTSYLRITFLLTYLLTYLPLHRKVTVGKSKDVVNRK